MAGNVSTGNRYSETKSTQFRLKLYPKHEMVLEALLLGFSALAIDTDVVFYQDPLLVFEKYKKYDIVVFQQVDKTYCAGLYFANPTKMSIRLHKMMIRKFYTSGGDNQVIFNKLLKNTVGVKMANLSLKLFPDGLQYNEKAYRDRCCSFANDLCCPLRKAVLFHNNVVYPKPWAKVYRFKEHLLWNMDTNR